MENCTSKFSSNTFRQPRFQMDDIRFYDPSMLTNKAAPDGSDAIVSPKPDDCLLQPLLEHFSHDEIPQALSSDFDRNKADGIINLTQGNAVDYRSSFSKIRLTGHQRHTEDMDIMDKGWCRFVPDIASLVHFAVVHDVSIRSPKDPIVILPSCETHNIYGADPFSQVDACSINDTRSGSEVSPFPSSFVSAEYEAAEQIPASTPATNFSISCPLIQNDDGSDSDAPRGPVRRLSATKVCKKTKGLLGNYPRRLKRLRTTTSGKTTPVRKRLRRVLRDSESSSASSNSNKSSIVEVKSCSKIIMESMQDFSSLKWHQVVLLQENRRIFSSTSCCTSFDSSSLA